MCVGIQRVEAIEAHLAYREVALEPLVSDRHIGVEGDRGRAVRVFAAAARRRRRRDAKHVVVVRELFARGHRQPVVFQRENGAGQGSGNNEGHAGR